MLSAELFLIRDGGEFWREEEGGRGKFVVVATRSMVACSPRRLSVSRSFCLSVILVNQFDDVQFDRSFRTNSIFTIG